MNFGTNRNKLKTPEKEQEGNELSSVQRNLLEKYRRMYEGDMLSIDEFTQILKRHKIPAKYMLNDY